MEVSLRSVVGQFTVCGPLTECAEHGNGHIHDTYRIVCDGPEGRLPYVLQCINEKVFHHVPAMMTNIQRVTRHLRQALHVGVDERSRRVLRLVPTHNGHPYWQDRSGQCWRVYDFIEGTRSVDVATSLVQIGQAAFAYGTFLKLLHDLPVTDLEETIPFFHHGPRRYAAFCEAVHRDICDRVAQVRTEIEWIHSHADLLEQSQQWLARGRLPLRVTHNDTKLNNVLLDEITNEGLCVIDLDTVMPGLALYDFGDMVRTMVSDAEEDEPDASQVTIRMDRFEALARGFLKGAQDILLPAEVESLVLGVVYMPMMMATRFLTDFLQGDIYYKIRHQEHNLHRCRVQLRLVEQLLAEKTCLRDCIRRISP